MASVWKEVRCRRRGTRRWNVLKIKMMSAKNRNIFIFYYANRRKRFVDDFKLCFSLNCSFPRRPAVTTQRFCFKIEKKLQPVPLLSTTTSGVRGQVSHPFFLKIVTFSSTFIWTLFLSFLCFSALIPNVVIILWFRQNYKTIKPKHRKMFLQSDGSFIQISSILTKTEIRRNVCSSLRGATCGGRRHQNITVNWADRIHGGLGTHPMSPA